jgi:hypothetical protein
MGSTTPGDQIVTALVSIITALTSAVTTASTSGAAALTLANLAHKHQQPRYQRCGDDRDGKGPVEQDCHGHSSNQPYQLHKKFCLRELIEPPDGGSEVYE